ncbi:MAG: helix-turn-helix domain-containing protein [Pseudomonadota bacterium]
MSHIEQDQDDKRARLAAGLDEYALGCERERILAGGRGLAETAFARQVSMYLVHAGFGLSLARVAAAFRRDRSTVAHACHQIEDRRDDPEFDAWIERLESILIEIAADADQRAAS